MKTITTIFSFALLLLFNKVYGNTAVYDLDTIVDQFTAMVKSNEKNDILGLSENNKYLFSISFNGTNAIITTECGGWVKPYEYGELQGLNDEYVTICQKYTEFNIDNISNLQHYIIVVDFPHIAFETSYTQGQMGSSNAWDYFMLNIGSTDKALYDQMIDELSNKLPDLNGGNTSDLVFGNGKEQIVSIMGRYSYKNNGEEFHRVLQNYRYKKSDFLNTNFVREFKQEVKAKSVPIFSLEILMQTTMDFFKEKLNSTMSCSELADFFEDDDVRDYWNGWCTALDQNTYPGISLDYIQTHVWPICLYLEKYVFLGGSLDQDIDEDFLYFSPVEYLAYLNTSSESEYLSRLDKLIDNLNAECSPPDGSGQEVKKKIQAITEIIRSPSADVNFYKQLDADELICLTTLYLEFYNTSFIGWLINEDYYFLQTVFEAIKSKGKQACKDFLDAIYAVNNSTSRIFTACDEIFTSQSTEFVLVSLISDVTLKAEGVSGSNISDFQNGGDYEGRLHGWKPSSFFTPCVLKSGHIDYFKYVPDGSNHLEFRLDYHGGLAENSSESVDAKWGILCTRTGENALKVIETPLYNPYAVVGVIGKADKVTIFTDCSSYQCKMPLQTMSAFQFAWMIEKKEDDDAFDKAILAIEVTSASVGVSQAMTAWKIGNVWRSIFLGMTTTGELVGSSQTQSTIESIGADLGEEAFIHAQKINAVLGFTALGSGGVQAGLSIVDASRAQTIASNLTKAGISFETSSELSKRLVDLRGIIDESPLLFEKALSDAGVSNNIITKLNAISDLENRIIVSGHILTSPNILQKVNTNPELFDFFESLATSTYVDNAKYVLKLSDSEMESIITKLDNSSNSGLITKAVESDELTYLILRAEKKGIDVFNALNSADVINDFDDFVMGLGNSSFYNFLKNAQNTLDFEKSMVSWAVLVGVPDNIRFDALNLQKVYDHIDIYGGTKKNFDTPIKSHQQWIDDLASSDTPYPSVTDYLPEGYPEIMYLVDYINIERGELISTVGFYKYPWKIINIPDEILAKLKHDEISTIVDPTHYKILIEEYNMIQRLHYLGFPVSEYKGIVKHRGVASLVTKKYAEGFKFDFEFEALDGALKTKEGLGDLSLIRDKLLDYDIMIEDLQYLISNDGRIVIHDPLPHEGFPTGEFAGLSPTFGGTNYSVVDWVNPHMNKMLDYLLQENLLINVPQTLDDLLTKLDNNVNLSYLESIYLNGAFNSNVFTYENGLFTKISN